MEAYKFGSRVRQKKPSDEKPLHRERGSIQGFRVAAVFEHPDGSFQQTKNGESEDGKMEQMTAEERAKKLAEITETAEKYKRENPEAAAKAEADAAAWVAEHREREFPFEAAVAKLRAGGASLTDAIRKAAAANTALHDDYLERVKLGKARPLV